MTDEQKQQLDDKMGQAFYNDVLKLEQDLADEQKRNAILREELLLMAIRVKDAETSRDTIRAHAQAGLDKYRAQNEILTKVRTGLSTTLSMAARVSERAGSDNIDKAFLLGAMLAALKDLEG